MLCALKTKPDDASSRNVLCTPQDMIGELMSWIWKAFYLILIMPAVVLFDSPACFADDSLLEPSEQRLFEDQEMEKLISAAGDLKQLEPLFANYLYMPSMIKILNNRLAEGGASEQIIADYMRKVFQRLPPTFSNDCMSNPGCLKTVNIMQNILEDNFYIREYLYVSFSTDQNSNTEAGKDRARYFKDVIDSTRAKQEHEWQSPAPIQNERPAIARKKSSPTLPAKMPVFKIDALDPNCGTEKVLSDAAQVIFENTNHSFSQKNLCGQDVVIKVVDQSKSKTKLFSTKIEISKCQTQVLFRLQFETNDVSNVQTSVRKMADTLYIAAQKRIQSASLNTYHPSIDSCYGSSNDPVEHY